jgi:hypothetical protein
MRNFALLIFITMFLVAPFIQAQSGRHGSKKHATSTPSPTPTPSASPTPAPKSGASAESQNGEKTIEETFGPQSGSGTSDCKTADLAKSSIAGFKNDCNAWIKERKSDLKDHFLTGACKEKCDDCGMSLKRCSVTGSVHYTVK